MGFSIINQPFGDTSILGKPPNTWTAWDDASDWSEDSTNLDFLIIFEGCFSEGLQARAVQHFGRRGFHADGTRMPQKKQTLIWLVVSIPSEKYESQLG